MAGEPALQVSLAQADPIPLDLSLQCGPGELLSLVGPSGKRYDVAVAGRRTAHASFFESHATDKADALSFAMDLTPLVQDEKLDVLDYTLGFLKRFENEVRDRFKRLG